DADQSDHSGVCSANLHSDSRTKRETAECDFFTRIFLSQIIQARVRIVAFAASFVMFACALADAAKVYSQSGQPGINKRGSCAKYYFVVHGPAAEWMRVQRQGRALDWPFTRLF